MEKTKRAEKMFFKRTGVRGGRKRASKKGWTVPWEEPPKALIRNASIEQKKPGGGTTHYGTGQQVKRRVRKNRGKCLPKEKGKVFRVMEEKRKEGGIQVRNEIKGEGRARKAAEKQEN